MRTPYCIIPAALFMAAVAHAGDRPVPQVVEHGRRVEPVRIASIGADFRLTSDWYDYGAIAGTGCSTGLLFDCFDPDPWTGTPTRGTDCGLPADDSRWFLGTSYCNPFVTNDYKLRQPTCALPPYEDGDRIQLAWYWTGDGNPNGLERCFVVFETFDSPIDPSCMVDRDTSTRVAGFVFDFGDLPTNSGDYFFADVDLCLQRLSLPFPDDGSGMYDIILAQDYDSNTGMFTLATCAQPMLWGTHGVPGRRDQGPGSQTPMQWDDDAPTDGAHTGPDECHNYMLGMCPEPLGAMLAVYAPSAGCGDCLTLDVPTLVGGSPATFSGSSDSQPNQVVTVRYAFKEQDGVRRRIGDFCVESQLSPPEGLGTLFTTTTDESGNYSAIVDIPVSASWHTFNFQAFVAGSCPRDCDSALVWRTVL